MLSISTSERERERERERLSPHSHLRLREVKLHSILPSHILLLSFNFLALNKDSHGFYLQDKSMWTSSVICGVCLCDLLCVQSRFRSLGRLFAPLLSSLSFFLPHSLIYSNKASSSRFLSLVQLVKREEKRREEKRREREREKERTVVSCWLVVGRICHLLGSFCLCSVQTFW